MLLRLSYSSFINELRDFVKKSHAENVYKQCLSRGKKELANKIANKYKLKIHQETDDILIAFQLAFMHFKK